MASRPRVVLDSVIFVRAPINPHGRCGNLVFERADEYDLIVSDEVVQEIVEVIGRRELRRKYKAVAGLNLDTIGALLSRAAVADVTDVLPISRDPSDDKFLAAALAGHAEVLVTEGRDLLVLGKHADVRIENAVTFLRDLDGKRGSSKPCQ